MLSEHNALLLQEQEAEILLELARLGVPVDDSEGEQVDTHGDFQRKYFHDPVAFVRDCIQWEDGKSAAPYQLEVIEALIKHKRVSAHGPHGLGKSTLSAWLILWFALTREGRDWKAITTASVWRQLEEFLWPEVRKWSPRLRWDIIGRKPFVEDRELLKLSISLKTGSAFAVASDKPSAIEGAHADHLLYIFDESKAIEDATFNAAEGAFSTPGEIYVLAVSTPGPRVGRFYEIHTNREKYSEWWVRSVALSECVAAGRVDPAWAEGRRREWGEDSEEYQTRVLGKFAESEQADGVIPRKWVKLAQDRWAATMDEVKAGRRRLPPFTKLGVDVGGEKQSGDATVIAPRHRYFYAELIVLRGINTMQVASKVDELLRATPGGAVVDSDGIGAGVASRVRQLGHDVTAFHAAEGTDETDSTKELTFENKRAWMWWRFREMLDPSAGAMVALPPDKDLEDELCAPVKIENKSRRLVIESKESIRKKLGRSTDRADAVLMASIDTSTYVAPGFKPPPPVSRPMG